MHLVDGRITYSEYGEMVERVAHGLIAAGIQPGEVVAIFLSNSWEFCVAFHAGIGGSNSHPAQSHLSRTRSSVSTGEFRRSHPHHRRRKHPRHRSVGIPNLRRVYTTRHLAAGTEPFANLLRPVSDSLPQPDAVFRSDAGDASLLQRNYRASQRGNALALQPGGEHLPIPRTQCHETLTQPIPSLLPASLPHLWFERDAQSSTGARRHTRSHAALQCATAYWVYWSMSGSQ